MDEKYVLKITKYFEFNSKADAEAFADFQQVSESDTEECTSVEVERFYDKRQKPLTKVKKPV